MSQVLQPRDQLTVHGIRADEALRRAREVAGPHEHGPVLPPAQATVAAHQPLERRHLTRHRVDEAVHRDVRGLGHRRRPEEERGGLGAERGERVGSGDGTVAQPVLAVGADRHGPVGGVHDREGDALVPDQPGQQRRPAGLDLGTGEPVRLTTGVDQSEVSRPEYEEWLVPRTVRRPHPAVRGGGRHGGLRRRLLGLRLLLGVRTAGAQRLRHQRRLLLGEHLDPGGALGVDLRTRHHGPGQPRDELGQALVVPVREHGTL